MILTKKIINQYPCKHIVFGVSHNKENNKQKALDAIVDKLHDDIIDGKSCISINFKRYHNPENLDENKGLVPIYEDITVCAPEIINGAMANCKGPAVGSEEVGMVMNEIKSINKILEKNVIFVDEGDKLSLSNTLLRGADALNLKENEPFTFIAGDIPLFYDFKTLMEDSDIKENCFVADFNSEHAFKEFFNRNCYWQLPDGTGVKEPNAFVVTLHALKSIEKKFDKFYANRQGGKVGFTLLAKLIFPELAKGYTRKISWSSWTELAKIAWDCRNKIIKKVFGKKYNIRNVTKTLGYMVGQPPKRWTISRKTAEEFGYYLFNGLIKTKVKHKNPFLVKDIDSWHDLFFYQEIIRRAIERYGSEYEGLNAVLPNADILLELNKRMKKIKHKIGILKDFKNYANKKLQEIRRHYIEKYGTEHLDKIPAQFYDTEGNLVYKFTQGENIGHALDALIYYRKKYQKDYGML